MANDAVTVDLVRLAQAGDRDALERLLHRYYDRVRRVVGIRMGPGVRRWTDSVDIMSRTLMKALQKFDTFEWRDESSLMSWLVKISEGMIRGAVDEQHAAKRDPGRERSLDFQPDDATSPVAPLPDPATTLSKTIGRNEDRDLVDVAIRNLEPADRDLLVEFYYLDTPWEEIAVRLEAVGKDASADERAKAADKMRKRADTARARLAIELQRLRRAKAAES